MITLTVISFNGSPPARVASASFDELGGSIGRADSNQLVLDDPDRTISRVHAQVVFRAGKFAVVDRGSNPIQVNGREVGSGREAAITDGDRVQIGGYVLTVANAVVSSSKASDDPFGDLLGPAIAPSGGARPGGGLIDPLAAFAADPMPRTAPGVYPRPSAPAPAPAPMSGVPEDWDPFGADPVPAQPAAHDLARSLGQPGGGFGLDAGGGAPAALISGLSSSGPGDGNSLDNLFGLKPGSAGDPLANSVLSNPSAKPNMAASSDPMQSLNMVPRASAATVSDAFSDLNLPFTAPPVAEPRRPPPSPPPLAAAPVAPGRPSGAVMSWDTPDPDSDGRTVIKAPGRSSEPAPVPAAAPAAVRAAAAPWVAPPLQPTAAPVAAPVAPRERPMNAPSAAPAMAVAAAGGADTAALLEAFRDGLATPTVQINALTPDLMRLIGQIVHESARGTVDLLVARAALKREVRAEATMIVARENNPLKFSPNGDAALQHLLAPPTRGFMAAAPAMRDAYDDLRAHQFGFIAGMRAALEGVLERFDPAILEGRLSKGSVLQSLVPGSRKARMWEVFTEHYAQISNDASDDFHTLFGKAFLKAYEEHIDQLKGSGP